MGWDFDLSRNSSLRTLETTAISITRAPGDVASEFLKAVLLSTVTSPLPLDVVVNYYAWDAGYHWNTTICVTPSERAAELLAHRARFKVFSEMYTVREFRLVFCAEVRGHEAEEAMRALERIVEAERMDGGFDYLSCEPSVIRTHFAGFQVHARSRGPVVVCVL